MSHDVQSIPPFCGFFLIYVPLIAWYVWKYRNANPSPGISSSSPVAKLPVTWKTVAMHVAFALQLVVIGAMIVALARPQTHDHLRTSRIEGTDIILALDISGSMSAHDFTPSPLRRRRKRDVASKFVSQRTDDNYGSRGFAGESLSLMPLTNDRAALINAISQVEMGEL